MKNKQIKIKFIEDCPEVQLTLWTLKEAISKDSSFILTDNIEEADFVVASRHYWIQEELDKIKGKKLVWINYTTKLNSPNNVPLIKTGDKHSYDASDKLALLVSLSPNYKNILNNWKLDTSKVKFLGYSKMELVNYQYDTTLEKLNLNPKLKTVLYTPTIGWRQCTSQCSYFDYINFLVFLSLEYKFNLIVRPHPYLLEQFPEIKNNLYNINKLDNIHIDYSFNYYPIFQLSDFIISDISSLAYEFLATTKPIILTTTSVKEDNLFKDYINYNIMYNVTNHYELINRVKSLLTGNDEFKNRRITFVTDLPRNPSSLIIKNIKEIYNEKT